MSDRLTRRKVVAVGHSRLIADADEGVRLEPALPQDDAEAEGLLWGTGQALLLQIQGILPLHIAAVARKGRAIGFVGPPGVGKTSLAAALASRGWSFVCDDIAAVHWNGSGTPLLVPNPPLVRIWGGSVRQLGWDAPDELRILGSDKYRFELPDRFVAGPVSLTAVYVIAPPMAPYVQLSPVYGHARFEVFLRGAVYNADLLTEDDERRWLFREALCLSQQVPVTMVHRPEKAHLNELSNAVLRHAWKEHRLR